MAAPDASEYERARDAAQAASTAAEAAWLEVARVVVAMAAEHGVQPTMRATGLSRQRIYQLRTKVAEADAGASSVAG